jgi:Protein of unknown function (DUF3800)
LAKKTYILALDDSGTRHPDRNHGNQPAHGHDWFAIGGVLFAEDDEPLIRDKHAAFCEAWAIEAPLHSSEIRAKSKSFAFLGDLSPKEMEDFQSQLTDFITSLPVLGHACVVDRPGYNARYFDKYGRERWLLCKSAFSIVVERCTKYIASQNGRLRVFVERSDKKTDRTIKGYYDDMRGAGMPFSKDNSEKYVPAGEALLKDTLFEFRTKYKTSPLVQVADLFLWPLAMSAYNPDCRPFKALLDKRLIIDCVLPVEVKNLGVKHYCFDNKKPG